MKLSRYSISIPAIFIFSLTFFSFSTTEGIRKLPDLGKQISGCWTGGLLRNGRLTRDIEIRYFKMKDDGTLSLALIYESGPRSRVWEYDIGIQQEGNRISWLAHRGILNNDATCMYLKKSWKGENTEWMFRRSPDMEATIRELLASKNRTYSYSVPVKFPDGLSTIDLESAGFEQSRLIQLVSDIKTGLHKDIHGVLLFRKGALTLEEYFAHNGEMSGPDINSLFRKKVHQLSSVTKGIVSLLTGVMIEQGIISGTDCLIKSFFPGYSKLFQGNKNNIRVGHLLNMTSGLEWTQFDYGWNDSRNNAAELYRTDDVIEYILNRSQKAEPGKLFNYSNGDPLILGRLIRNASGTRLTSLAERHLFNPLGITLYAWSTYPDGTLETDGGLALSARDLLKIGVLVLDGGRWNQKPVVSGKWIQESTAPRIMLTPGRYFGYYWNQMTYNFRGKEEKAYFLPGDGGQFLGVFPSQDMVVVFTGGNYDSNPSTVYSKIIAKYILPALR